MRRFHALPTGLYVPGVVSLALVPQSNVLALIYKADKNTL